ncbi:uncharacterized protein J4E78_005806 [Alternaria triticimaculans]|uniref:uncharacterized protein n=1 Tax=Alternaria triticimaculans TaxID=297637 RepID=UPI0020C36A12|nr:uncharacterized protein J4E78_005806 [Alternaria triticimaculans]KAI4659379.1 hypothetical protein J4E78_005806 [Alternaria triticimaculans]
MRTVTIALLCFLLLVAFDIGRIAASFGVFPLVVRYLNTSVSYLYWEICWEVYYQFTHNFEGVPLYLRFISLLICVYLTFYLYVHIKYTYWIGPHPEADQDHSHEPAEKGQSQETKLHVTPTIAHITPPPVTLPPAEPAPTEPAPPSYPPPFEFPFTNFRGTAYSSTEHEKVAAAPTIAKPEVAQITTKSTTTTTKDHVVIAPAHKVVELPITYLPAPPQPSLEDLARSTMSNLASQAPTLETAMRGFLVAASTGTEYMSSANAIWTLMASAESDLKPYFVGGMTMEQSFHIGWNACIVEFWNYLVPEGAFIQSSQELMVFLALYRQFANYLGLKDCLQDLIIVRPEPPASSTQEPPAPKMGTLSTIPTTTEHLPAPAITITPQPQQAPSTSAPIQQAPPQQPIVPQGEAGLIDFSNEDWFGLPEKQLISLTWKRFRWPNEAAASKTIGGYDIPELLSLPMKHPEFIMASYVKTELEKMAPIFKRASIVLRLQGRGCPLFRQHGLEMAPLMGNMTACLSRAAEMTNQCQEVADWDSRDEWYQACQYFHQNVFGREKIWDWLCHQYDSNDKKESDKHYKTRPLRELWEKMAPTWLPDTAKP